MVTGVSEGWSKQLQLIGVGYRATVNGSTLVLNLGFSHPVEFAIPEGIQIQVGCPVNCITLYLQYLTSPGSKRVQDSASRQ